MPSWRRIRRAAWRLYLIVGTSAWTATFSLLAANDIRSGQWGGFAIHSALGWLCLFMAIKELRGKTMRVDLGFDSSGEKRWAELTDLDDIPRKITDQVQTDVFAMLEKGEHNPFVVMVMARDTMLAKTIVSWSFGEPPAGDPQKVLDLPNKAYRILAEAIQPYLDDMDFMRQDDPLKTRMGEALNSSAPGGSSG